MPPLENRYTEISVESLTVSRVKHGELGDRQRRQNDVAGPNRKWAHRDHDRRKAMIIGS